jgi:hypothetical protein
MSGTSSVGDAVPSAALLGLAAAVPGSVEPVEPVIPPVATTGLPAIGGCVSAARPGSVEPVAPAPAPFALVGLAATSADGPSACRTMSSPMERYAGGSASTWLAQLSCASGCGDCASACAVAVMIKTVNNFQHNSQ